LIANHSHSQSALQSVNQAVEMSWVVFKVKSTIKFELYISGSIHKEMVVRHWQLISL